MKMSKRGRLPQEVIAALGDSPELLRLAERVAALAGEPAGAEVRNRRWPAAVAIAASGAVAAAVAVVLIAIGHAPGLADRALAAIGEDPVVHALVERTVGNDRTVDLATGKQTPTRLTIESWFDEQSGRLHVVQRRNGGLIADVGGTTRSVARTAPQVDPAVALFLTGYRHALQQGLVRNLGSEIVDGRRVRWLELVSVRPRGERIAVDASSFSPVLIQERDGTRWTVEHMQSVPLAGAKFRVSPPLAPAPTGGGVVDQEQGTLDEAARLLAAPVLALSPTATDLRLVKLELELLVSTYPRTARRRPLRSPGVELTYRGLRAGAEAIEVREARQPLPGYSFSDHRTFAFDPIPPKGSMQLTSIGGEWLGQLRSHRLYVTIMGPDAAAVIRTAKGLAPIRP